METEMTSTKMIVKQALEKVNSQAARVGQVDLAATIAGGMFGIFGRTTRSGDSPWKRALAGASEAYRATSAHCILEKFELDHFEGKGNNCFVAVNGFMTENAALGDNWVNLTEIIPNSSCYCVQWQSGCSEDWEEFFGAAKGLSTAKDAFIHYATNPWKKASAKSKQAGKVLANILRNDPPILRGLRVNLIGHSLGAAVVFHALSDLASTGDCNLVQNAVFLASAVAVTDQEWNRAKTAVCGTIVNVFSPHDEVLGTAFKMVTFSGLKPAGLTAVESAYSIDVSDLVDCCYETNFGHSYGPRMTNILQRVLPLLSLWS